MDKKEQELNRNQFVKTFIIENEELRSSKFIRKEIDGYKVFIANRAVISERITDSYTLKGSDFFVTFDAGTSSYPTQCNLTIHDKFIQENGCKNNTYDLNGQPANHNGPPLRSLKFKINSEGKVIIKVGNGVT